MSNWLIYLEKLEKLSVDENNISSLGAEVLFNNLQNCINIMEVSVMENAIDDSVNKSIEHLHMNVESLKTLKIRGNIFSRYGIERLQLSLQGVNLIC